MQHGLLCSQLGGLAHSKLNECDLDCSHGLLGLTALSKLVKVLQNKVTEVVL